ncbi:PspC domain-containing protein [candidate division KSB1 bacterium]|nr:PspC domain-containing protein [candidate division KSB1 bacterium]
MDNINNTEFPHSDFRRLYRSQVTRTIGGVCGGIAEYFNIEPILVRITFIILAFLNGIGVLAYLAGLIIIPENPKREQVKPVSRNGNSDSSITWGIILIVIGIFFILKRLDFWDFHWFFFWPRFYRMDLFLPTLVIFIGIFYLLIAFREKNEPTDENREDSQRKMGSKKLQRIPAHKMIAGVCTGLARYLNIDVTFVRLGWVFLSLLNMLMGILIYIVLAIALPEAPYESQVFPRKPENSIHISEEESL